MFPGCVGKQRAAAVIEEFERWQAAHPDLALASAAIHALTGAIRGSQASTMMGLEREMRDACATLRVRRVVSPLGPSAPVVHQACTVRQGHYDATGCCIPGGAACSVLGRRNSFCVTSCDNMSLCASRHYLR